MKVLLDGRGVKRTGRENPFPLFNLLIDNGIVPKEAEFAILGAARVRNNLGGHGAGATPRVLPPGVRELAVNCTATAISYLASLLS
jgi:hypothetical protein